MNIQGTTVKDVQFVEPSTFEDYGWGGHPAAVISLTNGCRLIPCRDPELNGMGAFYRASHGDLKFLRPGDIVGLRVSKVRPLTRSEAKNLDLDLEGHEQAIDLSNGDVLIIASDEEFNGLGYLLVEYNGGMKEVSNNGLPPRDFGTKTETFNPGDICEIVNCRPKKLNGLRVRILRLKEKNYAVKMLDDGGGDKWHKGCEFGCPPNLLKKIKDASEVEPGEFDDAQTPIAETDICILTGPNMKGAPVRVEFCVGRGLWSVELLKAHGDEPVGQKFTVGTEELHKVA